MKKLLISGLFIAAAAFAAIAAPGFEIKVVETRASACDTSDCP